MIYLKGLKGLKIQTKWILEDQNIVDVLSFFKTYPTTFLKRWLIHFSLFWITTLRKRKLGEIKTTSKVGYSLPSLYHLSELSVLLELCCIYRSDTRGQVSITLNWVMSGKSFTLPCPQIYCSKIHNLVFNSRIFEIILNGNTFQGFQRLFCILGDFFSQELVQEVS